jgi:thioredoxin reductase (NADPH)
MMTDILIIGAGPAGMTAAIYAVRAGVSAMILESNLYGGQIANTPDIENYPSIQKIAGWELAQNIYDQVVAKDVEVRFETVRGIELEGDTRVVVTDENRYEAKTEIYANGAKRRLIGCPGEEEFSGRAFPTAPPATAVF